MSIKIMSWVFDHSPYEGKARLVHLVLADHASDEGICWPKQTTIARRAHCSTEYVRTTVNQMIEDGYLEITSPSKGPGSSHRYLLKNPKSLGAFSNTPSIDDSNFQEEDAPSDLELIPQVQPGNTPNLSPNNHKNHQVNIKEVSTQGVHDDVHESETKTAENRSEKQPSLTAKATRIAEEVWKPEAHGRSSQRIGQVIDNIRVSLQNGVSEEDIIRGLRVLIAAGEQVIDFQLTKAINGNYVATTATASSDLPAGYTRKGGKIYGPSGYVVSPADLPRSADEYKAPL